MIKKWKRNKNLKVANFRQYLNCSDCANREKDKSTVFLLLLKIMAKKAWNFRKWEGKSG